jgi:hypothetical protein
MKLTLHTEDLSINALKVLKADLAKYSHLAAYKEVFAAVNEAISQRERYLKHERNMEHGRYKSEELRKGNPSLDSEER